VLDLRLEPAGTFEGALRDDEQLIAYGIGPDGDPLALAVDAADAENPFGHDEQTGWARFPKPRAERTYSPSVVSLDESRVRRTVLQDVDTTFPRLQPLPDGEILLVGTRSARREDGSYDLNGRVFGPDGMLRREFLLGDGIEDVQTTADGRIWVSYFDEGVFGNFGWGKPEGPDPIGAPGLIRWRSDGTIEWTYEPPPGLDDIADCYALNVATDAVWACYYSEFPLIQIALDDSIVSWQTPVTAAQALAVGEGRAAFYGGYGDDRDRCVLVEFREGELVELESVRLLLPSGAPVAGQPIIGRGHFLNVFDGPRWSRLDVRAAGR
jgi:hypothetical protein